jgi:hypothetical protein
LFRKDAGASVAVGLTWTLARSARRAND